MQTVETLLTRFNRPWNRLTTPERNQVVAAYLNEEKVDGEIICFFSEFHNLGKVISGEMPKGDFIDAMVAHIRTEHEDRFIRLAKKYMRLRKAASEENELEAALNWFHSLRMTRKAA